MARSLSVLQKATKADVRSAPFPLIVLQDALPSDLCDQLIAGYPALGALGVDESKNNARWSYPTHQVRGNDRISPLWKEFVDYHASEAFFHEIVDLFHEQIRALYPRRFPTDEALKRMRVGVRDADTFEDKEILLDAQISGNTPVRSASSVRTMHIDKGDKLFSGLFYLRRDDDDSLGGDLNICRFKSFYSDPDAKLSCFRNLNIDDWHVEVVDTVRYAKNVLVLFINSIDSLHAVTVRQPTDHCRIFLNLIGEVETPLYEIPKRWQMLPQILKRKITTLVHAHPA